MSGRNRKGQFFISGAIALAILLYMGMPAMMSPGAGYTSDLEQMSDNLAREIPEATNLILLDGDSPFRMGEFSEFVRQRTSDRYMDFAMIWVITVPDESDPGTITAYVGNWMGFSVDLDIAVNGDSKTMNIGDQETRSVSFSGVPGEFVFDVSFPGRSWSGSMARDKSSIYAHLEMSRGEDSVVRDING
jgi:hypothetical protein